MEGVPGCDGEIAGDCYTCHTESALTGEKTSVRLVAADKQALEGFTLSE